MSGNSAIYGVIELFLGCTELVMGLTLGASVDCFRERL
jgi:hypothetical protein